MTDLFLPVACHNPSGRIEGFVSRHFETPIIITTTIAYKQGILAVLGYIYYNSTVMKKLHQAIAGTAALVAISPFAGSSTEQTTPLDDDRIAVASRFADCKILDSVVQTEGIPAQAHYRLGDGYPRNTVRLTLELTQSQEGREHVTKYWDDDTVVWNPATAKAWVLRDGQGGPEKHQQVPSPDMPIRSTTAAKPPRQDVTLYLRKSHPIDTVVSVGVTSDVWTYGEYGMQHSIGTRQCGSLVLRQATDGSGNLTWRPDPNVGLPQEQQPRSRFDFFPRLLRGQS